MEEFRAERDTMGEILVPKDCLWGAQTERSRRNFKIGTETMPWEIIESFLILKRSCALTNQDMGRLSEEKSRAIADAADIILSGKYTEEFPLVVWQTGSGTQTNMNVNEVISHIAMKESNVLLHPNDDVNMSQSSNDTFPTAMNMAAIIHIKRRLYPAVKGMIQVLEKKEEENRHIIKIGRTHLQDAVPLRLSQEISGWRVMLVEAMEMLEKTESHLLALAIGGTAVGTGINCPAGFADKCCEYIAEYTKEPFVSSKNKFHSLTSKDAYVYTHGALKALAANLMKIANDIRWLASGPRCGIGELKIPENEPGSSIMPGKVNPTQCEALTMVALQIMGNDASIGMAASQGNFELNVYMPLLAYNMLQSIRLLSDAVLSFTDNCLAGIEAIPENIRKHLDKSLMLITCLTPKIGYDNAALAAGKAYRENITIKEAVLDMGLINESEYDEAVCLERIV